MEPPLEQRLTEAIEKASFEPSLCATFEDKVAADPVVGLKFLERVGAALTNGAGAAGGLREAMSEMHACVLLSYVVRIMRKMAFEECTSSASELRSVLQVWARIAASATATNHLQLRDAVLTMLSIILLQPPSISDPLFRSLLKSPSHTLLDNRRTHLCIRALAAYADAEPSRFCSSMMRVLAGTAESDETRSADLGAAAEGGSMGVDGNADMSKSNTTPASAHALEDSFVSRSEQEPGASVAAPRGMSAEAEVRSGAPDAAASASDAGAVQREEMQRALAAFIHISALTDRHARAVFSSGLWEVLLNMLLREAARNEQQFTVLVLWAVVEMLPHANANPPNITNFRTQFFDTLCLLLGRQSLLAADLNSTSDVSTMPVKQSCSSAKQAFSPAFRQCERWWASVDFSSGGWLQQSGLHSSGAGHGDGAAFVDLLWQLSSGKYGGQPYETDGAAPVAEHTGHNSDRSMKLEPLDALSAMQMRRLMVELFLYMYAAHPAQLLQHLTNWCSDGSEVNIARMQQITPLLERLRLHPDLYFSQEGADVRADKRGSEFTASLQTASPASVRLQVRSLWAKHEHDPGISTLFGGGQHLSQPDESASKSKQTKRGKDVKAPHARKMQRRHSFADMDYSQHDLLCSPSNHTDDKEPGRAMDNFEHHARELHDEFEAVQDLVRRCLWRQRANASTRSSWQPGCAVDLVSLFLASGECGRESLGQEDGTQVAKGAAQAPLRRRSFLHRLLSPLAAGSGYNPERVATDAHSSTAANDLDELSAAADAALASSARAEDESAPATEIEGYTGNGDSFATSTTSDEVVADTQDRQSTLDDDNFSQLMLITMELVREQHERARVEEQLRVQRSRLQEAEYAAANTATMTARLQAAQADVAKARTEAFELRRSLASMRGAQEKWAAQLQLKIRKFAHDRERASETGSELKVKAISHEQEILLLQEQLSTLASSEAHHRMIAQNAALRADTASVDTNTINVLLKQLAQCSELALSRGMALHSLQDVARNARRGGTAAASAVAAPGIGSAESDLHKLRSKLSPLRTKSMTPSQQTDSAPVLSRPHTPSRSPLSSPSPKQSVPSPQGMPFTVVLDEGNSSKSSNPRRTSDTETSQPPKASAIDVIRSPDSAKTVRRQQRDELASLFGGEVLEPSTPKQVAANERERVIDSFALDAEESVPSSPTIEFKEYWDPATVLQAEDCALTNFASGRAVAASAAQDKQLSSVRLRQRLSELEQGRHQHEEAVRNLQVMLERQAQISEAKLRVVQEKYDVIKGLSTALEKQIAVLARERDDYKARCERAEARYELQRRQAQRGSD